MPYWFSGLNARDHRAVEDIDDLQPFATDDYGDRCFFASTFTSALDLSDCGHEVSGHC